MTISPLVPFLVQANNVPITSCTHHCPSMRDVLGVFNIVETGLRIFKHLFKKLFLIFTRFFNWLDFY